MGFDEKCANYIASNPDFLPNYIDPAEVLKDRTACAQILKFLPQFRLLTEQAGDTFDVIGNEIMLADLAYYNSTGEAAKRGCPGAGAIHDDLATRYPCRPSKAQPKPA